MSTIREMVIAVLASAYAGWALYGAGYRSATWAMLLVFAGIPFYVWLKAQAAKQHPELVASDDVPEGSDLLHRTS